MNAQPSIQCPDQECAAVSYNQNDIAYRFCGRCHRYHSDIIYQSVPEEEPLLFDDLTQPLQLTMADIVPPMMVVEDSKLPDISQYLAIPHSIRVGTITGHLDFVIPDGVMLTEDIYLLAMARRYQQRLNGGEDDIGAVQAMQMAISSLEAYYGMEHCKFGDDGHRWDKSCAEEIVDEDLEHWEL